MSNVTEYTGAPECHEITISANTVVTTWLYTVTNPDPETAVDELGVPKWGDKHPKKPWLYVTNINAKRIAPDKCRVTLTYSREGVARGELEETEIEWLMGAQEEEIYIDLDGKEINVDPNGEVKGTTVYRPRIILAVTVYKSWFDDGAVAALVSTVNDAPFAGKEEATFLYLGPTARKVGSGKWQIRHEFLYNKKGHQKPYPEMETKISVNEEGEDEIETIAKKHVEYITGFYRVYESGNFSKLGLGL